MKLKILNGLYTLLICMVFVAGTLMGQNLVPNPGFEEIADSTFATPIGLASVPYWFGFEGSKDFFHRDFGMVPFNARGHQETVNGDGYAGIFAGPGVFEFLSVKLKSPLEKDSLYDVSFDVNLSNLAAFSTDDIGIVFTSHRPIKDSLRTYRFSVRNSEGDFVADTVNWRTVNRKYLAQGDEQYLSIGNFLSKSQMSQQISNPDFPVPAVYFYLDNIVVELPECTDIEIEPLLTDTTLCVGQEITLVGRVNALSHQWIDIGFDQNITVEEPGIYVLNNYYQCSVVQQRFIVAFEPCDCEMTVPTLFSTLYGSNHDLVLRTSNNVLSHRIVIFDALGQILHQSEDLVIEADLIPNVSAPYFWTARLQCVGADDYLFDKYVSGKIIVQN